jgi:flagellar hook-length control protein FliK
MTSALAALPKQTAQTAPTDTPPSDAPSQAPPDGFQALLRTARSALDDSAARSGAKTSTPQPPMRQASRSAGESDDATTPPTSGPTGPVEPDAAALAQAVPQPVIASTCDSEQSPARPPAGRKAGGNLAADGRTNDETTAAFLAASAQGGPAPTNPVPPPMIARATLCAGSAASVPERSPATIPAMSDAASAASATTIAARMQQVGTAPVDQTPAQTAPKPPDDPATAASIVPQPPPTPLPQPPVDAIRTTEHRAPTDSGAAISAAANDHRSPRPSATPPSSLAVPSLPTALAFGALGAAQAPTPLQLDTPQVSGSHSAAGPSTTAPEHAPLAHQLAPALLSVAQGADGSERMTVRLSPAELGFVQVRIDRLAGGATHVAITAERPQTLQTLEQDQAELHRALDHAGVPAEGRTLAFHVAASPQSAPGGNNAASGGSGNGAGASYGSGSNRQAARDQSASGASRPQPPANDPSDEDTTPQRWQRVGLDITA